MSNGIGIVEKYWCKLPYQNLIIDHIVAWRYQHAGIIDYWSFLKGKFESKPLIKLCDKTFASYRDKSLQESECKSW